MAIVEKYVELHNKMIQRYSTQAIIQQEDQNAMLLQDFLHNMKRVALNRPVNLSTLDKVSFDILIAQLKQNFAKYQEKMLN